MNLVFSIYCDTTVTSNLTSLVKIGTLFWTYFIRPLRTAEKAAERKLRAKWQQVSTDNKDDCKDWYKQQMWVKLMLTVPHQIQGLCFKVFFFSLTDSLFRVWLYSFCRAHAALNIFLLACPYHWFQGRSLRVVWGCWIIAVKWLWNHENVKYEYSKLQTFKLKFHTCKLINIAWPASILRNQRLNASCILGMLFRYPHNQIQGLSLYCHNLKLPILNLYWRQAWVTLLQSDRIR